MSLKVTPHVAQNNKGRRSAIDQRTTRHPGYSVSQQKRKRVEEIFGWLKTVGGLRKLRHRGLDRVELDVHLRGGGLQPGPTAEPAARARMNPWMTRAQRPRRRNRITGGFPPT